ncbi:MAG: hypothetical protein GDA43_06280 [Hormoscilla sp. SP5CHS1]|nr:hypothetical protein [Hormoscilla sp. SP5CHS1]
MDTLALCLYRILAIDRLTTGNFTLIFPSQFGRRSHGVGAQRQRIQKSGYQPKSIYCPTPVVETITHLGTEFIG